MPSPDEIIQKFKDSASKERWSSPEFDPNGALFNKAVSDLRDLLDEDDMNAYSQKAFTFMESLRASPSVGTATCLALLEKGDQGKAVATDVAKRVMSQELSRFDPTQGFLRSQHAINGLTKQFIQETSPDYERALREKFDGVATRYTASGMLDRVSSGTDADLKAQVTVELGQEMVAVLCSTPMSQDAVAFLKEMRDAIESNTDYAQNWRRVDPMISDEDILANQQGIAEIVVNNNSALRFAGPVIAMNQIAGQNELWREAQASSLSTFSAAKRESAPSKVSTDDPPEIASFKSAVTKGIHQVRGMVLDLQEQFKAGKNGVSLEAQQLLEKRALEHNLKPHLEKIASLEKKQADLNKPISLEKIKAFFSAKGIKGAKQEVASEIINTQNSVKESRTQLDTRFKNLKAEQDFESAVDKLSKRQGLNPKDLQTALQMPAVNKALMEFARKEHNAENLEFHQAVVDFKKLAASGASIEDLRNAAQDINRTFVTNGSPKEINISSTERSKLENDLNDLSQSKPNEQNFETWGPKTRQGFSEVFDQSDAAVLNLVRNDTFRRFTADPSFKDAVTKSAKPPLPKVGETTGINQQNSLKNDDQKVAVKSTKVGVG